MKYYACASVQRHLEKSLRVPDGPIQVKAVLKVLESTNTMCKAVFLLDDDDNTALVQYMIDCDKDHSVSEIRLSISVN